MLNLSRGGPAKVLFNEDDNGASVFASYTITGTADLWSLLGNETVRGEIALLYPQDVMVDPGDPVQSSSLDEPQYNGNGNTTLAQAATGNQIIDGILSGIKWDTAQTVYYSDTDSAADYQAAVSYTHLTLPTKRIV